MAKIQVSLDAAKLRSLISKRTYKNREGIDVEVQEVKFELVEVKEPKTIYTNTEKNYRIDKTHFACVIQTKEEREAKAETIFIGDGFTTIWDAQTVQDIKVHEATIVEDKDDLPF